MIVLSYSYITISLGVKRIMETMDFVKEGLASAMPVIIALFAVFAAAWIYINRTERYTFGNSIIRTFTVRNAERMVASISCFLGRKRVSRMRRRERRSSRKRFSRKNLRSSKLSIDHLLKS